MDSVKELFEIRPELYEKWQNSARYSNGNLRNNLIYGESRNKPIDDGALFTWLGGTCSEDDPYLLTWLSFLSGIPGFKVFTSSKRIRKNLAEQYKDSFIVDESTAFELLATSKLVVSFGFLPAAFSRRERQFHYHIVTKGDFGRSRIRKASGCISILLNSNAIICETPEDRNTTIAEYQLAGIYNCDQIIVAKSVPSEKSFSVADLCNLESASMQPQQIGTSQHKEASRSPLTKILIYFDCNANNSLSDRLLHFLACIDYSQYDVTIINGKKPRDNNAEIFLESIDERVRIMNRTGTFSCTEKNYIEAQSVLSSLRSFNDPLAMVRLLPEGLIENELNRLFSETRFDRFLFFGIYSPVWFCMTQKLPADKKIHFQTMHTPDVTTISDESNASTSARSLFELEDALFDKTVCWNANQAAKLSSLFKSCTCSIWDLPFPASNVDLIHVNLHGSDYVVIYQNRPYGNRPYNDLAHRGTNIIQTTDKARINLITFSDIESLDETICQLNDLDIDAERHLYIFTENGQEPFDLSNITPLPYIHLIDIDLMSRSVFLAPFIREFDAYLVLNDGDDSALKMLCEEMDFPVRTVDTKAITQDLKCAIGNASPQEVRNERIKMLLEMETSRISQGVVC